MTTKYAFPCPPGGYPGMTLRDYFAGQIIRGFTAFPQDLTPRQIAQIAYELAELMVETRDKFPAKEEWQ